MKQETELVFIMTAQLVKPVNRDDLPQMKGLDGIQNKTPLLGTEPKGEGIKGASGFSTSGATATTNNTTTTDAATTNNEGPPAAKDAPAKDATKDAVKDAPKSDATKTDGAKTEATKSDDTHSTAQLPVRDAAHDLLATVPSVARVAPPPNR
jgi:hypothetical protein